jgi:transposase
MVLVLEALVSGTRDPEVLAELAQGKMRRKIPELQRALIGRFSANHALIVSTILAKLDFLEEAIAGLTDAIEALIGPFEVEVALLDTIPGVDRRIAECLIAEIGIDMSRFQTSAHLSSWAGMCPGNNESGGRRRSVKTRNGSKWLAANFAEAAKAAGHSKDTCLGAQFQRLRGRLGHAKARKAVEHSMLVAAFHVLDRRVPYVDLGADWFQKRRPDAHARRLARQIEALGYRVTIEPAEAA